MKIKLPAIVRDFIIASLSVYIGVKLLSVIFSVIILHK